MLKRPETTAFEFYPTIPELHPVKKLSSSTHSIIPISGYKAKINNTNLTMLTFTNAELKEVESADARNSQKEVQLI